VLISDGHDNVSWFERRRALRVLERNGIPVDGIEIPFSDSGEQTDIAPGPTTLRDLTRTGGRYFSATTPNLAKELAARFADLRNSYILTYTPENVKPQKDGWHEIKVTLRPGVRGRVVQGRPGYYARTNK
jgi:hypothetical protein